MKKISLILCSVFFTYLSHAQSWGHPGSKWAYEYYMNNSGVGGVIEYTIANTFSVGTKTCQQLTGTFSGTHIPNSGMSYTVIPNFRTYTTCKENNVIYFNNDTIVNFNAAIGDKWLRATPVVTVASCNSRRAHVVLDTGHIIVNGFNLRTVVTQYTSSVQIGSNTFSISVRDTIIERIRLFGGLVQGNDMLPLFCENDNTIVEYIAASFRCYSDDKFPAHNGKRSGCGRITGVNELNGPSTLRVIPNPSTGKFTISGFPANEIKLTVFNSIGLMTKYHSSEINSDLEIDISQSDPGIYFLRITSTNGSTYLVKLVKQ